jgi:hypothetical protein
MKKAAFLLAIVGLVGVVMAIRKRQPAAPKPTIWQKMQEGMEAMPEDFPPRVMFDNVEAVRENTDRILEMLSDSTVGVEAEAAEV